MERFIHQRSKKQLGGPLLKKGPAALYACLLFLLILLTVAFLSSLWSTLSTTNSSRRAIGNEAGVSAKAVRKRLLNCSSVVSGRCAYPKARLVEKEGESVCPEYFRWIHEDVGVWKGKGKGISREMVEMGKKTAHFRLVVKKGRVYVEQYKKSIQTRDVFTMWGILQLVIRRYPGMVPDLELMFDCDDLPVIPRTRSNLTRPPPLFRYCGHRWNHDIVFPDWSFWGWYVPSFQFSLHFLASCLGSLCGPN